VNTISPHGLFQQELSFIDSPQKVKPCSKCGKVKPFSDFHKRKGRKIGVASQCKQCVAAPKEKCCLYCHEMKPLSEFPRTRTKLDRNTCIQCLVTLDIKKECSRCHQPKPLSDFTKRSGRSVGVASSCKQCLSETRPYRPYVKGTKYPSSNPAHQRNKSLQRLYGITSAEYDAMLEVQGGVCKVCKGPPHGRRERYHVDHDHDTGKVRGLLCHKCNVALGMVQDSTEHLKALITYLEELT